MKQEKPLCYDEIEVHQSFRECYLNHPRCSCRKFDEQNKSLVTSLKALDIAFLSLCYKIGVYKLLDWLNEKLTKLNEKLTKK